MNRFRLFVLLLFVVVGLLAGCSSLDEVRPLDADPEVARLAGRNAPETLKKKVMVAPPRLGFDPERANAENGSVPRWFYRPALQDLQKQVVEALRDYPAFREVIPISEQKSEADMFRQAASEGVDLLVTLEVTEANVSYEGVNGWYLPNVVNWITNSLVLSWWIADEDYSLDADLSVRVSAVGSERPVHEVAYTDIEIVKEMDDFDRGWHPLGIFRVPDSLDATNWDKIIAALEKHWVRDVQVRLVKDMDRLRNQIEAGSLDERFRKSLLLAVGVSQLQDEAIPEAIGAQGDATVFRRMMLDPKRAGLPTKNTRLLLNRNATRARIKQEMSRLFAASTDQDTCILYFAGYGAVAPDGSDLLLLPYDVERSDLARTALSLQELTAALEGVRARDVVIVLDASFGGEGGRTYRPPQSDVPDLDEAFFEDAVAGLHGDGRTLYLAAGPGQAAHHRRGDGVRQGTFTFYLLEASRRQGFGIERLPATLQGAFRHARRLTPHWMMQRGVRQRPLMRGKPRGEVRLRPRPESDRIVLEGESLRSKGGK